MTSLLTIQLLGHFQMKIGDAPIALHAARARSLLAFLLLQPGAPRPRDQIAYRFWPESTDAQARANLRKLLHQLRKTAPELSHYLAIEPAAVGWRPGAPVASDVGHFEDALAQAETARAAGDSAGQRQSLEHAVEQYSGDLLPECYDDWIQPERERLRQAYGDALDELVHLLEAQSDYRSALHHARQLRRLHPLREGPYRQLMRLYSLSGDRASAVETFRQCQRLLRDELGVEPSAATRELYARIVATDGPARPLHNLPRQLTSFVGREEELAAIRRRFQEDGCRLLTLVGPGGMGKTRLALEAASRLVDHFQDGAFFVPLEAVAAPHLLVTAVAEALDFSFYRPDDLKQQLIAYLGEKQILLVLDNFEHMLDAAGLLAQLLEQARSVRLLVTSRERLKLPQEWLLELDGLPRPADAGDERLETYAAVQLLLQRARQVRPRLAWSPAEKKAAVHICHILGGMPLGIELAAAWLRVLSFREIESELAANLDVLPGATGDLPPRHRSLRAVFEQSWRFLSAGEKRLWEKLTIFRGRFDRRAAAYVAGASPSSLMALVDKSLLRLDGAGRYATHGLVRQVGLEKLSERPEELAAVRAAHGAYYARFLEERERALFGRGQREALTAIAGVIDDVRAAWEWAVAEKRLDQVTASARALARFYEMRGWFTEGRERYGRAVARLRAGAAPEPETDRQTARLLARLLIHEGLFLLRHSDFEGAAARLRESLAIGERIKAHPEVAAAATRLAEVRFRDGDYARARQLGRNALAYSRPSGNLADSVRALSILGQVAFAQGRFDEASDFFEESRALCQQLGDLWALAHLHNNLGMVSHELGRYDDAWDHFRASLDIFRDLGDRWGQALVTNNMGQSALLTGRSDEAEAWLQKSLALRREFGNRWAVAFVLNNLGRLNLRRGHLAEARACVEESLAIRRHFDDPQGAASCLLNLGDIALAMEETETARERYVEGLQTAVAIQNESLTLTALLGMARVLLQSEKDETVLARELLALVAQHPAVTDETKDKAERLAAEVTARFPPEGAEGVQRRSEERSLAAVAADLLARFT